jgi:NAD(P)-dependent dehydrogenase (short-subunit alcohol dehydrogenase family)
MYLPGQACLLHNLELKFVAPIVPPATLLVNGRLTSERHGVGRVEATVSDSTTGAQYVTAAYQFGRYQHETERPAKPRTTAAANGRRVVLVTGASGGLGRAVVSRLGDRALGVSRAADPGLLTAATVGEITDLLAGIQVDAIVHCAWPLPDNQRLVALADPDAAVGYHLARPLTEMIGLARLLKDRGTPGAQLILIGSTAAMPGRHNYRMPLYSLAKSLVPELVRILAVELAPSAHRATGIVFDVIEAGMNQRLSAATRIAHTNRSPSGRLPSGDDAAAQVEWILSSPGWLASGATVTLSGGALP